MQSFIRVMQKKICIMDKQSLIALIRGVRRRHFKEVVNLSRKRRDEEELEQERYEKELKHDSDFEWIMAGLAILVVTGIFMI